MLGPIHPHKATLCVKQDADPKFKPRPVATRDAIGQELDRLEQQCNIKKVETSDWAAHIVAVPKKDGRFSFVGITKSPSTRPSQWINTKPEDPLATLANGKVFSKLDLSQAHLQLPLDEKSMPYVTVNTQQGLYQYIYSTSIWSCLRPSHFSPQEP